ncbi:hypothetical protein ABWH96_15355 [Marivirga tractuosa]|uniref:OmpP1/FadL family transporter n=1 Tax=Marivirga tractuosa TaxID=1006 RepID=UPI0035CF5962
MKTLKYFFTIFISVLCSFNSIAQVSLYTADAVRFSQTDGGGSARFVGLGGANVSLGGDISSISGNPAGLGFYNRSAWAFSPVLRIGDYSASYEGESTQNMGGNFQIPNMGMVFHNRYEEYAGSKWISGTFGVAINQKQSFYNNINYRGTVEQDQDGIIYDFTESALFPFLTDDGFRVFNFQNEISDVANSDTYTYLAYQTYLLQTFSTNDDNLIVDRYDYDGDTDGYLTESSDQTENIDSYSGLTTLDLSYGANYNDVLYLGASANINFLNYRQVRNFRETPSNNLLNYMELNEETVISGTGAAFTIGAIYKPLNILNLGFSYTTPTFISLTETQEISMESFFIFNPETGEENISYEEEVVNEVPAYSLRLPQKISVGATAFISKYGFLTADLEYVDYASARYSSSNGAFGGDTPDVGNDLQSTFNLKVGAEGRWNILRGRLGFAYFDNPYRNFDNNRQSVSAGLGIMRKNGFFVDATYRISTFSNPEITAYPGSDVITSESNISSVRLTLGKSF